MSFDLSQFYQVFFEETTEHLTSMERLLLALDVAAPSMDDLNAIFRAAHSIKGGAGTFGFTDMTEVTHILETLLDKLRKQEMTLTDDMVSAFLQAGDVISMQLAAHRDEGEVDPAQIRAVCTSLERFSSLPLPTEVAQAAAAIDDSYGFFNDVPDPALTTKDDAAYGFFEDTPQYITEQNDNQDYGFFTELAPDATVGASQAAEMHAPAALLATEAHPTRRASDRVVSAAAETSIRVSV